MKIQVKLEIRPKIKILHRNQFNKEIKIKTEFSLIKAVIKIMDLNNKIKQSEDSKKIKKEIFILYNV